MAPVHHGIQEGANIYIQYDFACCKAQCNLFFYIYYCQSPCPLGQSATKDSHKFKKELINSSLTLWAHMLIFVEGGKTKASVEMAGIFCDI